MGGTISAVLILLNKECNGPFTDARGAISYGFEMLDVDLSPSNASSDGSRSSTDAFNLERLLEEV